MKRVLTLILAVLMVLSVFAGCGGEKKEEKLAEKKFGGFAVGYAKADITPDYTLKHGIVGNNDHNTRLSTGVLEPIMATCLALTDEDGTTMLVYGTDLHGTYPDVLAQVQAQLNEKTGLPKENIEYNATHNHCGPAANLNSAIGPQQIFSKDFLEKMVKIGMEALENRKVAKMYTTFTRPEDMVFVRHYILKDGTIAAHNGNVADGTFYGFEDKGDNLLQMVKFVREGEKDVIMFNWQGHPFSSTQQYYTYFSGVSPAIARRVLLEKANTESIYIMGASGNSVQQSALAFARKYKDNVEYGTALADAMIAAFPTFKEAETGKIYRTYNNAYVPASGGTAPLKYVLSAFGFGDVGYVSAPSEMFQSNAFEVRNNSPWKYTFYAQISNGVGGGYVPDADAWANPDGCYERGPCKTMAGDGEAFAADQLKLLNEIFEKSGQSVKEKDEGYITVEERNTDGQTYTNPKVGGKATATKNGFYQVNLMLGISQQSFLCKNEEVAKKVMSKSTMKIYTNYSNLIVDCE